jgi:hypothetical protein
VDRLVYLVVQVAGQPATMMMRRVGQRLYMCAARKFRSSNGRGNQTIELWPCGYDTRCNVRNCRAKATTLARSIDGGGRPIKQYELCSIHADQVVQREKLRGRGNREVG